MTLTLLLSPFTVQRGLQEVIPFYVKGVTIWFRNDKGYIVVSALDVEPSVLEGPPWDYLEHGWWNSQFDFAIFDFVFANTIPGAGF